jgi:iron complex outermembrane receptor protein
MRAAIAAASMLLVILSGAAHAQEKSLTELDLATLMGMDVKITSAARREQSGSDAAAAIFVLTREDIRRNGATSIPELLRMVPGMHVGRIANGRWAVSARGFNGQFANKLLVLVDGRIIYSPLFTGVAWEDQQVPLEEIERIEVIRGPGGALWGANAVNGIINIITRSAAGTSGLELTASAGDEESHTVALRYGGSAGEADDYRVYVENFERDSLDANLESWRRTQAGGRWDHALSNGTMSLHGEVYDSQVGDYLRVPGDPSIDDEGGNLNAHLNDLSFGRGTLDLRTYASWRHRHRSGLSAEKENVMALDAQLSLPRAGRHLWTLGTSARRNRDEVSPVPGFRAFDPQRSTRWQWAVYGQDEIFLLDDALRITAGAKLEDPGTGGSALQPTLRALWHVNPKHVLWSAVSRSVRSPSRLELDARLLFAFIPGTPAIASRLLGNDALQEETMHAGEIGWRWRPRERLSFDFALFEHRYEDLIVIAEGSPVLDPGPPPVLFIDSSYENRESASTHGAEASIDWIATPLVRIQGSLTTLKLHLPSQDGILNTLAGVDAEHSAKLRAEIKLPWRTRLDLTWRGVGELRGYGIGEYDSLDVHLSWNVSPRLEISARVDNLFDNRHIEYFDEEHQIPGSVLGRSAFLRLNARLSP